MSTSIDTRANCPCIRFRVDIRFVVRARVARVSACSEHVVPLAFEAVPCSKMAEQTMPIDVDPRRGAALRSSAPSCGHMPSPPNELSRKPILPSHRPHPVLPAAARSAASSAFSASANLALCRIASELSSEAPPAASLPIVGASLSASTGKGISAGINVGIGVGTGVGTGAASKPAASAGAASAGKGISAGVGTGVGTGAALKPAASAGACTGVGVDASTAEAYTVPLGPGVGPGVGCRVSDGASADGASGAGVGSAVSAGASADGASADGASADGASRRSAA